MSHGGDIYRNRIRLDFSVNVNPLGINDGVKRALLYGIERAETYPDPLAEELRWKIARHFGKSAGQIVCGNGASELISAICHSLKPKKALLVAPGFSGYERALGQVGAEVSYWMAEEKNDFRITEDYLKALETEKPDLIILINPGNPTGVVIPTALMEEILKTAKKTGTTVVVDECFLELTEKADESLAFRSSRDHLYILRAFTKSFAIPGIRLGYLVCPSEKKADLIAEGLPEWNVSVPAQFAGMAALDCGGYLFDTWRFLKEERPKVVDALKELGLKVYLSEANFLLLYENSGIDLKEELLKKKILIRDCSDYKGLGKGFYRIAIKKPEENQILLDALKEILQKEE